MEVHKGIGEMTLRKKGRAGDQPSRPPPTQPVLQGPRGGERRLGIVTKSKNRRTYEKRGKNYKKGRATRCVVV